MRFGSATRVRDGLATQLVQRRTFEETRAAMLEGRPAGDHTAQPSGSPGKEMR